MSSSNSGNDDTNNLRSSGYSRRTTDDRRNVRAEAVPSKPRQQHQPKFGSNVRNDYQPSRDHHPRGNYQPRDTHHSYQLKDHYQPKNSYQQRNEYQPRNDFRDRGRERYGNQPNVSRNKFPTEPRNVVSNDVRGLKRPHEKELFKPNQISLEDELKKLESKLNDLSEVDSIDQIKVIDSRWNVKPKGFEEVGAARAKLSGLFPLPGYPRPVDFTKLEGLIKDRMLDSNDVLHDVSKIEPFDSRAARILIIEADFKVINYLKIVEFFNDYLKMIDYDNSTNNIHSKRKSNNKLIIEFNDAESATIIYSLNGTELLSNAYKEDDAVVEGKFKLQISRPDEYVVSEEQAKKVSILIDPTTKEEVQEKFTSKIHYLRQKDTQEPLGLVFADSDDLEDVKSIPFVKNAFYSCESKSIQPGPINYSQLKKLVNNVPAHAKSKVIQLSNAVTIQDLMDDSSYQFILKDMKQVIGSIGKIVSIKIPRPANDFTPGLSQFNQPGLGKIFVEFEDEELALKAIMELSGRSYNDRAVLCSYFSGNDYRIGIL